MFIVKQFMFYEPNNFYNTVVRIWESESVFFFGYFYMQTCTGTYNVHATCIYFFTCLNLMFIFFFKIHLQLIISEFCFYSSWKQYHWTQVMLSHLHIYLAYKYSSSSTTERKKKRREGVWGLFSVILILLLVYTFQWN